MATIAEPMRQVEGADVVRAMEVELRLLGDLREALSLQRAGVAADDPEAIEAATHGVARGIFTLDEARRRREWLAKLAGDGDGELRTLESLLGPIPGFAEMRRALRHAAEDTARELNLNQAILRRALRSGETYLQALFTSVGDFSMTGPAPSGMLMNRSA